jgi:predicted transcriptional regulator
VANQGYQVVIPTPDASVLANLPNYEKYYTATFHIPKSLIKYSQLVEEVIGCLYDLTDKDLLFLHALDKDQREKLTDDEFEKIMFILDEMNFSKVGDPTIDELATEIETNAIQQEKESLQLVLDYYLGLSKKKNTPRLRPVLKVLMN